MSISSLRGNLGGKRFLITNWHGTSDKRKCW